MRRMLVITALFCASSVAVQAQEGVQQQRKAALAAMKKLAFLSGSWGGIETYNIKSEMVPRPGKYRSAIKTTSLFKGLHLMARQTTSMRPRRYEATGIWSYDVARQEYVLNWFDSNGGMDRYRGQFSEDGKGLQLGLQKGEAQYILVWEFHDAHHYSFQMKIQRGEQEMVFMTAEYTRAGKGPRMLTYSCRCGKHRQKPLGAKAPS